MLVWKTFLLTVAKLPETAFNCLQLTGVNVRMAYYARLVLRLPLFSKFYVFNKEASVMVREIECEGSYFDP